MGNKRDELLQEAIRVESNMAKLYTLYSQCFAEDKEFWEKIAGEEEEHASIIGLGKDVLTEDILSDLFLYNSLDELRASNEELEATIERYGKEAPSRQEAYDLAIKMEEKVFEKFYQQKMTGAPGSDQIEIIQKLNNESRDHAERIRQLIK